MTDDKLKCILLVDDDEAMNFYHKKLIVAAGINVAIEVAENGQEALDFIQKKKKFENSTLPFPDLIFLDINMPVMDGWEFLEELEKLYPDYNNNKIVMMLTTSLNAEDIKRAKTHEAIFDYITKPLNNSNLVAAIHKFEDFRDSL
jgi:CheY-like chemotaxis protein